MYLFETGLGEVFKQRSKYQKAQLENVSQRWSFGVPFRKKFDAFRQELSNAIRPLVTGETDQTEIDRLIKSTGMERELKWLHDRLLKRKSPMLKESDPVKIYASITFNKKDYTDISSISVLD